MPLSDVLRQRAAEHAAQGSERGASRIIAAERLGGYTPFAMHPLSGHDAAGIATAHSAAPDSQSSRSGHDGGHQDGAYQDGRKSGLADGFQQGFEAGAAHANAEHRHAEAQAGTTLATRIQTLCEALQQRFDQIERDAADEVVALALEVARQALRATLAVRPESIVPIVQEALAHLFDEQVRTHLHLNPAELALVREELGDRLTNAGCELVGDASISPGGCRIETPRAAVDATIETRWRRTLAAIGRNEDGSIAQPQP